MPTSTRLTTSSVFLLLLSTTTTISAGPIAPKPQISSVSYSGNGCGSVTALITNNGTALTTFFDGDKLRPYAGPGVSSNYKRKLCTVQTKVNLEPGWQVRVNVRGSDVHGDIVFDEGLNFVFLAMYSVDGIDSPTSSAKVQIVGPHNPGEFTKHADPIDGPLYGNCNGSSELSGFYSSSLVQLLSSAYTGDVDPDGGPWVVETSIDVVECK